VRGTARFRSMLSASTRDEREVRDPRHVDPPRPAVVEEDCQARHAALAREYRWVPLPVKRPRRELCVVAAEWLRAEKPTHVERPVHEVGVAVLLEEYAKPLPHGGPEWHLHAKLAKKRDVSIRPKVPPGTAQCRRCTPAQHDLGVLLNGDMLGVLGGAEGVLGAAEGVLGTAEGVLGAGPLRSMTLLASFKSDAFMLYAVGQARTGTTEGVLGASPLRSMTVLASVKSDAFMLYAIGQARTGGRGSFT